MDTDQTFQIKIDTDISVMEILDMDMDSGHGPDFTN